ncbi:triphosphoribosyl-dephospho-CoA synthase CitG [Latilactobacillus sakei]|uniref:triphosphoribosyl-dephospho-CoA synthase CitG n=1 Tax=Latilactobacillus sakei TaxID=1599 RepID=UPI00388B8D62
MNSDLKAIAILAYQSLIAEVQLAPKPGLVDPESNGAHDDMDYPLFLKSIAALKAYLLAYIEAGYQSTSDQQLFLTLRQIGQDAEKQMLLATSQINTHKGANFSYAFILGAIGRAGQTLTLSKLVEQNFKPVFEIIRNMTKGLVSRDFSQITDKTQLSYGEQLYVEYGFTGIRGEAEAGYPSLEYIALPTLQKYRMLPEDDRHLLLMLTLITEVQDMNLVHRGGIDGWQMVQKVAAEILQETDDMVLVRRKLRQFDAQLIEAHLSPGGTADLLSLGIFLERLKYSMATQKA